MRIRPEAIGDHGRVRVLYQRAFGDARVLELLDALRSARAAWEPVSLVAEKEGEIVGHVMLSASRLDAPPRLVNVGVLSPLAVSPEHQRQGLGTALVAHAIDVANREGIPLVFLEGDPDFYAKRGFKRASGLGFRAPSLRIPDPAFQVAVLDAHEPWMTGTLIYADAFWATDCVGLR